ncbi:Acyl-CoA dehydrogenase fadE12 [Fulvia fulva]|uniref:Acyl-CoA dehydrogenase fadE12 n=1 Tax=Passalora fulva TaxID=5499 RepID=A0A9Q8PHH6_PASFU|nr:Acyl-CoA dehydrogenase fadE12 [Fulvia fulva]KAK4628256.1 Acyl-CoA dehydrogenase fadE12 [Fulvia fulva]UJO22548.1 Acyl-CoA dehydrogenase fadE12 [Fulvia fulva]WPV28172.1 Acyl-CoA dehydrogenase fadE12 [Fulvia fulva]
MAQTLLSSLRMASRTASLPRPILSTASRCTTRAFSETPRRRDLMETSGFTEEQMTVRESIMKVCSNFPDDYWMEKDYSSEYPHELHAALAKDGWIGIALPENLGGSGLGISEATMMMQSIAESGAGMAGAQSIHANVYATQPVAKFATEEQRDRFLKKIISGEWRTCFGVTEPNTGLDTLKLKTTTTPEGDGYRITGQKIWITNAQIADKMVLLARTTPLDEVTKPSEGLSMLYIDLNKDDPGLEIKKIRKMGGRAVDANQVFFDNYYVPKDALIGKEGSGFKQILHGMNAERCLLAGEALGLGYAALKKSTDYARERVVFGRPIGQNQAIQHPLASAYMQLEAAKLATYHAARLYDRSSPDHPEYDDSITQHQVGVAANSAKYVAAEAAYTACERSVMSMGGMGYAAEYHVERYLRECFVPRLAPVSREMIMNFIGEKALGLPRSY